MDTRIRTRAVLCGAFVLCLGGCIAGGSSSAPPVPAAGTLGHRGPARGAGVAPRTKPSPSTRRRRYGPGWLSPQAKSGKRLVYVTNIGSILIFPRDTDNPNPIGEISDGITSAYGAFVDAALNLYVTNQGGSVAVYPLGQTSPSFTYSSGLSRPLYSVADSHRLFVGDADTGQVVEYALGNGQPQYALQSLGGEVDGVALDSAGNLYAAYRGGEGGGGVEFWPQGAGTGQNLGIHLNAPQGLAIDSAGNIVVADTDGAEMVEAFHPGQTSPFAETPGISGVPTGIAVSAREGKVFVSELSHHVQRANYPKLSEVEDYLVNQQITGVQGMAISPPDAPTPVPSPSPMPSASPVPSSSP
jgi:hypothetical protein